jgi:hypothetical protein
LGRGLRCFLGIRFRDALRAFVMHRVRPPRAVCIVADTCDVSLHVPVRMVQQPCHPDVGMRGGGDLWLRYVMVVRLPRCDSPTACRVAVWL